MNKKKALAILLVFTLFLGVITPALANTINTPFDLIREISTGTIDNFTNILDKSAEYIKNLINKFTDMGNHWADEVVGRLVDLGAIGGYADNTFKPDNNITRAEFSKILNVSLGLGNVKTEAFADTTSHWGKENINTLAHYGIIDKSEYGRNYNPDRNITRIEIAKMIVRASGLGEEAKAKAGQGTGFTDNISIKSSERGYVIIAKENKLIGGYPDNTFRPNNEATRAEASAMIVRTLELISKTDSKPKEVIKEEDNLFPEPIFGIYNDTIHEEYKLYVENFKTAGFNHKHTFRATCINRTDLNKYTAITPAGSTTVYRNQKKSFKDNEATVLYELPYGKPTGLQASVLKDKYDFDIKKGEELQFEVTVTHEDSNEIKTYYTSFNW